MSQFGLIEVLLPLGSGIILGFRPTASDPQYRILDDMPFFRSYSEERHECSQAAAHCSLSIANTSNGNEGFLCMKWEFFIHEGKCTTKTKAKSRTSGRQIHTSMSHAKRAL